MAAQKTPQQLVKEKLWYYTQMTLGLLACIGSGYYLGFLQWGDAPRLKKKVSQLEENVVKLRNERQNLESQLALVTRDRDDCRKSAGGAAPATPPAPGDEGVVVE